MIIDIKKIKTFEEIKKVYTTQLRTIYEVIEEDYFNEYDIYI